MKDVDIAGLIFFEAEYGTHAMPPPYSYHYKITGRIDKEKLAVDFILNYTGRETLDEEEILEEGFTLNDDTSLRVSLSKVWIDEIKNRLKKSGWLKQKQRVKDGTVLEIKVLDSQGNEYKGTPDNPAVWEYFLQEMIQAIYEVGRKEMPLEIKYKEIEEGKAPLWIVLQPVFSTLKLWVSNDPDGGQRQELPWQALKKILKTVYIPYYDTEDYIEKEPVKPGKYIDIGEGKWYKFGQGARNPGKENKALERLEQQLKGLL